MAVESAKGVRDFIPSEKIIRDELVLKLTKTFQRYGFLPLETSLIERLDTLTAKFAAGTDSDASKEIFKFQDQGERKLGLRFDLTVPTARFVAQNPNLRLPFKRYEIGKVYRDGPIKLGRYREFYQCDVDTIGVETVDAEIEIILLALNVYDELGLDAYIEVNDRMILNSVLNHFKVSEEKHSEAIIIIDKLKKIGNKEVEHELEKIGIKHTKELVETLQDVEKVRKICDTTNIDKLLLNVPKDRVKFMPSLARGLSYYTGIVFEGFLHNSEITSSICGGGRYDKMIGLYGDKDLPAVGISFGLEPITEYLKIKNPVIKKTTTKVFVIPIKTFEKSLEITQKIRHKGINAEIDLMGKGISKNLDYANSFEIPFVVFVGQKELDKGVVKVKDMISGKEEELTIDEMINFLKNHK